MRKPSIFSRDYEKQIRKRKRIIMVISILILLLVSAIIIKFTTKSFTFTEFKSRIQQWIDKDSKNDDDMVEIPEKEQIAAPVEQSKPIVPEVKFMEFKISDKKILKVEYEEIEGKVKFKNLKEIPENIEYDISPSKELIVVTDDKQNIKIFNTKGEEKNITKENYISPDGEVFTKDIVQKTYTDYLWHKSAKFINDEKIIYKSNMPYFGYELDQYLWIVDIDGKNEVTLWQSKGRDITIGEIKEKGIEVTIDGNVKYINNDNNLVN